MNILVVDDHPSQRKLHRVNLTAAGHTVFEAADGQAALELLGRERVDAVISDILMPQMDGLRLCQEIRQHAQFCDLPVILCSSTFSSLGEGDLAISSGADKFLPNPVSAATLLATLAEVAARARSRLPRPFQPAEAAAVNLRYSALLGQKVEERRLLLETAAQALNAREARLSAILECAIDAIIVLDHEGRIVEFNPAAEAIFGHARAAVVGREMAALIIPPALREGHRRGLAHYLATGEGPVLNRRIEITALRADGTEFPVELAIARVAGAEPPLFTGFIRDITDRKQAEARIRHFNRVYAVLSDINQAIVRVKDPPALLAAACRIAVEKGGFRLAWIGLVEADTGRLQIRAHAGADTGTLAILEALIEADPPAGCSFTRHALCAGGHGVCNDIANDPQAAPWRAEALSRGYRAMAAFPLPVDGQTLGCLNLYSGEPDSFDAEELHLLDELAADIAFALEVHAGERQRRRADQDLRASEERFRQVVENIREVFWITDLASRRMLYISPAYATVWGRTCASLYESPKDWLEAVHPDDRARVRLAAETRQVAGEYAETYRILRPDGSLRWIRAHAFPVRNAAGEAHRIVGVAEDITERKNAEQLALRSQRLEAIGTLASGVAHDFNNALAPIVFGLEMLRVQHPEDAETLDMFLASARRGENMVRQLLGFAKGAEGKRVALQPLHLVRELEQMIRGSFPKNIRLVDRCPPDLPLILGDATQLGQVLLNLCVNARDAMPDGGTLTLEAQCAELDAAQAAAIPDARPGQYVLLRVRDTGTGIPLEIMDRIFDPFFTTKGPNRGTGLGLSTVLGIVRGHGGFLQAHSQPGQGAAFTVYLPADRAGSLTEPITRPPPAFRGREELILFVDDEPAIRTTAHAVLRALNFRVVTATDGTDALKRLAEHRDEVHVLVTDSQMPYMDGLTLARSVRQQLPSLPILLVSGRLDDSVARELKALGRTACLDKPFTAQQLAGALQNLLAAK